MSYIVKVSADRQAGILSLDCSMCVAHMCGVHRSAVVYLPHTASATPASQEQNFKVRLSSHGKTGARR